MNRPQRTHAEVVGKWMLDLADMCAGRMAEGDLAARINKTGAQIAADFPDDRTFTTESRAYVAASCNFFPGYSELKSKLSMWWDANRPPSGLALVAQDDQSLTMADRSMLVFWGEYKSQAKPLPEGVTLSGWLSMCRAHVPGAFKYLVRHDDAAAAIAIRKGWDVPLTDVPARRREPSEGEVLSVEDAVKRAMQAIAEAKMRQGMDPTSAHSFSQLDEDAKRRMANWEKVKAQREAQTGRKFGSVSDAEIKATRDADPRVQAARRVQAEQRAAAPPEADSDAPRMPWEDSR